MIRVSFNLTFTCPLDFVRGAGGIDIHMPPGKTIARNARQESERE
jgi:hypothetical protein